MRAIGPGTSSLRPGITVMAVGAIHLAVHRPGRDQAGYGGKIFPDALDRMITLVGGVELQARVRFDDLTGNCRGTARNAVGMAAKAKFIFPGQRFDDCAGGGDPGHVGQCTGSFGSGRATGIAGVGIVAIGADDVT